MARPLHRRSILWLVLVALAAIFAGVTAGPAPAAEQCSKTAALNGSDTAPGTVSQPYRTARRLMDSLAPGETGCLRSGRYEESLKVSRGGRDGSPITLRSFPGERAELKGRLWVSDAADYVTFSGLTLDGTNPDLLPSPTVNGDDIRFTSNDITNHHTAICFVLGTPGYGRAARTTIESNHIHDCGRLPANNHEHGIYVEYSVDALIRANFIYDNADRGVQLYPDAQRTRIEQNVIDGNGQGIIFSGDDGKTSSDTTVEHNVITNAVLRDNVESYYPTGNPIGQNNRVRENCIAGGARDDGDGGIQPERIGFTTEGNLRLLPRFKDRGAGNLQLDGPSACSALLDGAALPGALGEIPSSDGGATTPPDTGSEPDAPVCPTSSDGSRDGEPASKEDGSGSDSGDSSDADSDSGDSGDSSDSDTSDDSETSGNPDSSDDEASADTDREESDTTDSKGAEPDASGDDPVSGKATTDAPRASATCPPPSGGDGTTPTEGGGSSGGSSGGGGSGGGSGGDPEPGTTPLPTPDPVLTDPPIIDPVKVHFGRPKRAGRHLRVTGTVLSPTSRTSTLVGRRVSLLRFVGGRWRPVGRATIGRGARFSALVPLGSIRGRTVGLRVLLPGVGRSRVVRMSIHR